MSVFHRLGGLVYRRRWAAVLLWAVALEARGPGAT